MYRTLEKKISELKKNKKNYSGFEQRQIQEKIERYENEQNKIKQMFPEKFFEDL